MTLDSNRRATPKEAIALIEMWGVEEEEYVLGLETAKDVELEM